MDFRTVDAFWSSFGETLQRYNRHWAALPSVTSAREFARLLDETQRDLLFGGKNVVIFLDEFDKLYFAPIDVIESVFDVFRGIKQERSSYCLQVMLHHFVLLIGTTHSVYSPSWPLGRFPSWS